ncbi:MAG: Dabb family protein [Clostridia bacterium]|nr:Dabb family protein [Clostridia bacterium]
MVKHYIVWKLKEGIDLEQVKKDIKSNLEGLVGQIEGLLEMKILTDKLSSSSGDVLMDSTFASEQALKNYSVHPKHVFVANTFVRPYTEVRLSFDVEIKD